MLDRTRKSMPVLKEYDKHYTQQELASFSYEKTPCATKRTLKKPALSWFEYILRILWLMLILEVASYFTLIPFSIVHVLGLSIGVLMGLTVAIIIITYLCFMAVSPRSIPFYHTVKNLAQSGKLDAISEEAYCMEREQSRHHSVARGYFTIGHHKSCVSIHTHPDNTGKWVIYIPGAGSHPGDYTDTKSGVNEINTLFHHHNVIMINRPFASFAQGWSLTPNTQTPMDTVKAAFLYVLSQQPSDVVWYGHCMGAPIMAKAIDQIKHEYSKAFHSIRHRLMFDRTFMSVTFMLNNMYLPGFIPQIAQYNFNMPLGTFAYPTLIIDSPCDELIPPSGQLGRCILSGGNIQSLNINLSHNALLSSQLSDIENNHSILITTIQEFINRSHSPHLHSADISSTTPKINLEAISKNKIALGAPKNRNSS